MELIQTEQQQQQQRHKSKIKGIEGKFCRILENVKIEQQQQWRQKKS